MCGGHRHHGRLLPRAAGQEIHGVKCVIISGPKATLNPYRAPSLIAGVQREEVQCGHVAVPHDHEAGGEAQQAARLRRRPPQHAAGLP